MSTVPGQQLTDVAGEDEEGTIFDLEDLGTVVATAKNAKDYTFYLMIDRPDYTAAKLNEDPGCIADEDLLFKSSPVADKGGMAQLELKAHEQEIRSKYNGGRNGRLAVYATSKADNEEPEKTLVVCVVRRIVAPWLRLENLHYVPPEG